MEPYVFPQTRLLSSHNSPPKTEEDAQRQEQQPVFSAYPWNNIQNRKQFTKNKTIYRIKKKHKTT